MNQFYFVFASQDEARAYLPSFNSPEAVALRQKAEQHAQNERDSFDRCDTDGCVTQWCSAIFSRDAVVGAELADTGNMDVFKVLLDAETGEVVATTIHTFQSRYTYGNEYKWAVRRNGSEKAQWVTDYKRESSYAAKGLKTAWIIAPAKLYARHPGNHLPEQKGLSGLASYRGKLVGIDYDSAGLRP